MKKTKKEKNIEKIVIKLREHKHKILLGFPILALIGVIAFLLTNELTLIITFIVVGASAILLVYFSLDYFFYQKVKAAEKSYPDFLEDLAEAKSSGMTMSQAVKACKSGEYGELVPYIKKLNTLISWGMPFNSAWTKFTKSLKDSALISRFNTIVLESIKTGADTAAILTSLASRAGTIRDIEENRKSVIRQQVVMMYVLYFGFIGIIILLQRILLPTLYIQNLGSQGMASLMDSSSSSGTLDADYFKQLFMLIVLIQAISTGVIIGQILEDKIIGGIKHIAILLFAGIMIFLLVINPASVSVNQFISNTNPYAGEEIDIGGTVNIDGAPASNVNVEIKINGETYSTKTNNQGQFSKKVEMPSKSGTYALETKIHGEEVSKTVREYLTVI